MKASLLTKLTALADRHQEVAALLGDAEVIGNQDQFRDLSREFSHLDVVVAHYQQFTHLQGVVRDTRQMLDDPDEDIRALATEEIAEAEQKFERVLAGTKPRFFPVIYFACITAMRRIKVGQ